MKRALPLLCVLAACSTASVPPSLPPPKVVPHGSIPVLHAFQDEWRLQVSLADCDEDGKVEGARADGTLVRWDEAFVPTATAIPGFPPSEAANTVMMADVNGDRWLDLATAGPHGLFLRLGTGKCAFGPPQLLGEVVHGQAVQLLTVDADRDGLTDLMLGVREDPLGPSRLFLAHGDGSFEEVRIPMGGQGFENQLHYQFYASLLDDVDGDGILDLFSFNDDGWSYFGWGKPGLPPTFATDDDRTRVMRGSSPMSLSTLDSDRNGRIEYFVANIPGESDLIEADGRDGWHRYGRRAGFAGDDLAHWGSYTLDANRDGWPDLLVLRSENGAGYAGRPAALFVNQRDGTFRDTAPMVQLTDSFEARGMSCGDIGGDGRPSCVVNAANGSWLLRNSLELPGNWIGVRLLGSASSADAVGARITEDGDGLQAAAYGLQSPTNAVHDPEVFFALGERTTAKLHIVWPSGVEERQDGLAANEHHILREPQAYELDRRVVPADGAAEVLVTVDLDETGSKDATIEREGEGRWAGAVERRGNVLTRRLVAPAAPGEARLTIALDGKALLVHPRVRFVAN